ncbi:MAG TPA: hypothetical protein VFZ78_10875, partial [Flavisolibacter sp.]
MKKLFLFILCATGMLSVSAQRVYYIYIETENHQSFYVKSNDEVQSSNGGFMILSNLQDSTYHYFIGFSGNPAAEAKFRIDVQARDRGFVLKNIDGAPALFDLQSLSLLRPESRRMTDTVTYAARTDDFSMLLSKAANDSTLLRTPVYARAEPVAIVTNPSRTIEDVAKEVNPAETPENTKKEEQPVVISEPTVTKNEEQQPEKVIERHTDTTAVAADVRNAVDTAKTITQPEVAE